MNDIKLSKFLSLILRHKPEILDIVLDRYGWADVNELLLKLMGAGKLVKFDDLKRIVDTDDKKRYIFNSDFSKIRANQGHSINIDLSLEAKQPPEILFHGTAVKFLKSIIRTGIKKQNRQFVHLSKDYQTALKVGKRHGKVIVLRINSAQMFDDGQEFFLSENGVWLTGYVSKEYIIFG